MMPFPGGIGNADNIALLMSAVAAVLYLLIPRRGTSWWLSALKTLSTSLLAIIAWRMGSPALLVAGLALSAVGDLFREWSVQGYRAQFEKRRSAFIETYAPQARSPS